MKSIEVLLFGAATATALVATFLYWLESRRTQRLEQQLTEKILAEHEKTNSEAIDHDLAGRSDAELFRQAVHRGLQSQDVPPVPRSKGNKP